MSNYIYGNNTCLEAINNNRVIKAFILNSNNLKSKLIDKHINFEIVDNNYLNKLSKNNNHQGIVCECKTYKLFKLEDLLKKENGLIVLLDGITDPHNFGAIIRTCEASGVDGIIYKKDNSVKVNDTVAKVASGALEYVKICEVTNLNDTIKKLKEKNYWIVGTSDKADKMYDEVDYKCNIGLVIGSEGNGISSLVKKNCDFLVKLPMKGHINSLNASVATGIFIYHILNNRVFH